MVNSTQQRGRQLNQPTPQTEHPYIIDLRQHTKSPLKPPLTTTRSIFTSKIPPRTTH